MGPFQIFVLKDYWDLVTFRAKVFVLAGVKGGASWR